MCGIVRNFVVFAVRFLPVFAWHGDNKCDTNFADSETFVELAARVPFMLRVPGAAPGRTRELAELVDLYPTLADLASVPLAEPVRARFCAVVPGSPF